MRALVLALVPFTLAAADWRLLFNGKTLDGWEKRGTGEWTVLADGTLVAQRNPREQPPTAAWPLEQKQYNAWRDTQAWLYTMAEFSEYDLSLEYWLRVAGNSGISLHDPSRGEHGIKTPPDFSKTPSKLGYEIQLANLYPDPHPSGSIYTIAKAKVGAQRDNQWNRMEIEVRKTHIKVKINGALVAEAPTDPKRPKSGPIGLQLHDAFSVTMFRNIRIREMK